MFANYIAIIEAIEGDYFRLVIVIFLDMFFIGLGLSLI
jgi:hypothetical protein